MAVQVDDTETGKLGVLAISSLAFTVALIFLLQTLYLAGAEKEFERKVIDAPWRDANAARAQGTERLNTYGWVDAEADKVHIPIEDAMERYLDGAN
jgi:hypothetical protein